MIVDGCEGVLVDGKPGHIAESILDLVMNPERARMLGRRAAETARTRLPGNAWLRNSPRYMAWSVGPRAWRGCVPAN